MEGLSNKMEYFLELESNVCYLNITVKKYKFITFQVFPNETNDIDAM